MLFTKNINSSVNYTGPRLMVGYKKHVAAGWTGVARIGVAAKLFFDGLWDRQSYFAEYYTDDYTTYNAIQAMYYEVQLGRQPVAHRRNGLFGTRHFPAKLTTYEGYLGVEKQTKLPGVKRIEIGLEASYNMFPGAGSEMTFWSRVSMNDRSLRKQTFQDPNICIGLRLGVGLWK